FTFYNSYYDSFSPRRSADLLVDVGDDGDVAQGARGHGEVAPEWTSGGNWRFYRPARLSPTRAPERGDRRRPGRRLQSARRRASRSEEHTSELQSRVEIVCRL